MALANKYYLDFKSQDGKDYRIQILGEGWGGANTDISVADDGAPVPVNINWKGDNDIFSVFHGSNLNVGLYSVTDLKWREFFDVAYAQYAAELIELGSAAFNTKSLLLDGVNEYVNCNTLVGDFASQTTGTWSFWVKPVSATPSSSEEIIQFGDADANETVRCQHRITSGNLRFQVTVAGTVQWSVETDAAAFTDNTWAHVCLVQDGVQPVIYINGTAVAQTNLVSTDLTAWFNDTTGIDNGKIGAGEFNSSGVGRWFNGNVDEVNFFSDGKSSGEVTTIYNSGVPKDESATANLVAGYRMGEGASDNWNVTNANEWTFFSTVGVNNLVTVNCENADVEADVIASGSTANVTKWTGYVESGMYGEPWQGVPYPINLNFTCGLGRLKNVSFTADGTRAGTKHTGSKHLLEVIRLCLNQLKTPLTIREVYNIYEETQTTAVADSPLTQVYIKPEFYNETDTEQDPPIESAKSCWDVLNGVLGSLGARIFQWDNIWYIVRHEEIDAATLTYREFLPSVGSESSTTVNASGTISHAVTIDNDTTNRDTRIFPFNGAGDLSVLSALEKILINYKPMPEDTLDSDLVKNPCLHDWSTTDSGDGMPQFWTAGSGITDPNTYASQLGLGPFAYPPCEYAFGFKKSDLDGATSFDADAYIEMTNSAVPVASADLFTFSFGYMRAIEAIGMNAFFLGQTTGRVQIRSRIQIGTKYWVGNNLTSSMTGPDGTLVTPAAPVWSTVEGWYDIYTDGYLDPTEINNQFNNHTVQLSAIGLDGTFSLNVRLYLPWNNIVDTNALLSAPDSLAWEDAGFYFTGVHCWYLPSGAPQAEEVILSDVIDADSDVYEITVMHGDGPSAGSLASFRLSDDSITNLWSRRGQGDGISITKQLANMITRMMGDKRINVSGGITGEIDYYNRLETTVSTSSGDITYQFLIQGLEWDVQNYEYNINMVELDTSARSITSHDITINPFHPPESPPPIQGGDPPVVRMEDDIIGDTGIVSSGSSLSTFPSS